MDENGENGSRQQKYSTCRGWQAFARQRPTGDYRPCPTVGGRITRFVQDLFSWIQELNTLIKDFVLRLGDSRDDLRNYSQGILELKKEEQSRATNWRLSGAIN
ncbi:hypothetical protein M9H77_06962 [Catharanthus roseus]|uniref:Uncharacterized protein n=1 Tax=Catharanthus roseus TaxID=4058 RepID=A0ACC0BTK1_CATRO|nr:hypothetical protein M9H77_06962 [Catharanthus roseus]